MAAALEAFLAGTAVPGVTGAGRWARGDGRRRRRGRGRRRRAVTSATARPNPNAIPYAPGCLRLRSGRLGSPRRPRPTGRAGRALRGPDRWPAGPPRSRRAARHVARGLGGRRRGPADPRRRRVPRLPPAVRPGTTPVGQVTVPNFVGQDLAAGPGARRPRRHHGHRRPRSPGAAAGREHGPRPGPAGRREDRPGRDRQADGRGRAGDRRGPGSPRQDRDRGVQPAGRRGPHDRDEDRGRSIRSCRPARSSARARPAGVVVNKGTPVDYVAVEGPRAERQPEPVAEPDADPDRRRRPRRPPPTPTPPPAQITVGRLPLHDARPRRRPRSTATASRRDGDPQPAGYRAATTRIVIEQAPTPGQKRGTRDADRSRRRPGVARDLPAVPPGQRADASAPSTRSPPRPRPVDPVAPDSLRRRPTAGGCRRSARTLGPIGRAARRRRRDGRLAGVRSSAGWPRGQRLPGEPGQEVEQARRRGIGETAARRPPSRRGPRRRASGSCRRSSPQKPDPRRDGAAEVAARPAARRGAVADPAARRLRLGRRAVRAPPRRHDADGSCDAARRCHVRAGPVPCERRALLDRDHRPVGRVAEVLSSGRSTVTEHWPCVAPFGIVVVNVARPVARGRAASRGDRRHAGTASVNVTLAPASGSPSGSVTVTVSVTGSGRLEIA